MVQFRVSSDGRVDLEQYLPCLLYNCLIFSLLAGQSLFSGMDYWNGLLEWTTGMPFDLKFNHKTPIVEPIGVWDGVYRVHAHSLHSQQVVSML